MASGTGVEGEGQGIGKEQDEAFDVREGISLMKACQHPFKHLLERLRSRCRR